MTAIKRPVRVQDKFYFYDADGQFVQPETIAAEINGGRAPASIETVADELHKHFNATLDRQDCKEIARVAVRVMEEPNGATKHR